MELNSYGYRPANEAIPFKAAPDTPGRGADRPRESQVQTQLSILNKVLNSLGEEIQALEGRLSGVMVKVPLLNPAIEAAETTEPQPLREVLSPLSERIASLTRQANQIGRNVQRIRECLQV